MKDLAPMHYRQRLIIEGMCDVIITSEKIEEYLIQLSDVLKMHTLSQPVTNQSPRYGWAGWIHWETSGCHFYAWDEPYPFFSADIYACKTFEVDAAIEFTREFFQSKEVVWKEA